MPIYLRFCAKKVSALQQFHHLKRDLTLQFKLPPLCLTRIPTESDLPLFQQLCQDWRISKHITKCVGPPIEDGHPDSTCSLNRHFEDDLKDCHRDHWFAEYIFHSMLVDVIVLHVVCNFIIRYEKRSIHRSLGTAQLTNAQNQALHPFEASCKAKKCIILDDILNEMRALWNETVGSFDLRNKTTKPVLRDFLMKWFHGNETLQSLSVSPDHLDRYPIDVNHEQRCSNLYPNPNSPTARPAKALG